MSDDFSVEAKERKKFVGQKFMEQAIRNCPTGKTPIVIVHILGKKHDNDLVMIRLKDWIAWMGGEYKYRKSYGTDKLLKYLTKTLKTESDNDKVNDKIERLESIKE